MSRWKETVAALGGRLDSRFDQLLARVERRLDRDKPYQIVPYRGYGNAQQLLLRGRVLQDKPLRPVADKDSIWDNLHSMYQRFASDEVAGAIVEATVQGQHYRAVCDAEGYFSFELTLEHPLPADEWWHAVPLTLQAPIPGDPSHPLAPIAAIGQVFVPPATSTIGIISDIDDTVLQTGATNLLKMARVVFLNNARTRLPFEGVAGFYQALCRGASGTQNNPIFYVSSSPWNLYDLLIDFLEVQGIPVGPLFLQDYGIDRHKFITTSHAAHKLAAIEALMHDYPALAFVLIGDSGQEDPEIYTQVLKDFPGRVRAVYIRDVSKAERATAVQALIQEAALHHVDMLLVPDTLTAAHHAHAAGLINADLLPLVYQEKAKDATAPTDVELLLEKHG